MTGPEPEQLNRGKAFHRVVQALYSADSGALGARAELYTQLPTSPSAARQRHGRIDVFVDVDAGHVAIIEIKATQWDRIRPANVRRNLRSHAEQLQDYVDQFYDDGSALNVSACIIYPRPPEDPDLRAAVESFFDELAIAVVYIDPKQGS